MSEAAGIAPESAPRRRTSFLARVPDPADGAVRLDGRRVLVTGAQSGVGAWIAVALARAGALVALSYSAKDHDRGRLVASVVRETGSTAAEIEGDPTDPAAARQIPRIAAAALGGLDALIHTTPEHAGDDADSSFEGGVIAMLRIARAAIPLMGPGSRLVYAITRADWSTWGASLDVAAIDAATEGWTRGFAAGLADHGIGVNAVSTPPAPEGGGEPLLLPVAGRWIDQVTRPFVLLAAERTRFTSGETVRVGHAVALA